jgi:molecular chaperone DnaK
MSRNTIDYGMDLGTTNSSVAVLEGNGVEVIRNNENTDCTPSTVWIDKKAQLRVGRTAYERLESDNENAYGEFKLQMGTNNAYKFPNAGRSMQPEELSAEILKSMRADVKKRRGEDITAAVITVPAAFELPQCEATKKAAQMAGLTQSPLLQEPVAAAMAYGFQSKRDKVFWLVYDFGGGTFDAAVVSLRDGVIQVVNHGGDNHLGGKYIDWAIVEQLLVPALLKDRKLTDFRRGNPKWKIAFAKLKLQAEQAKIRVSNDETAPVFIENFADDRGETNDFEFELRRGDVERLMEPFVLRTVNICRQVLTEKRLAPGNIEKLLLVGGPTQAPFLRERLSDASAGLGIELDFSIDPMTAVARGAAIFSGAQRVASGPVKSEVGQYGVELDYQPVGSDPEPMVGGRVVAPPGANLSGHTIEFVNSAVRPPWRSGKMGLSPEGGFVATLWAEKGRENVFDIELRDTVGNLQKTVPEKITYRVGVVITAPPLINSVGVALANNEVKRFAEKGMPLPARKRHVLHTAMDVRRGQPDCIRVPVVEGDNTRADRNHKIGEIVVSGAKIRRDVPANSEIEVIIEIDESRLIRTKAYIPVLDEEFEEVLGLEMHQHTPEHLRAEIAAEKKRLADIREKVRKTGEPTATMVLQRIDGERMLHEVETALAAVGDDPEARGKCGKRLLDLKQAIDEAEDALEWPTLVAEAELAIERARQIAEKHGKPADRESVSNMEREIRSAIGSRDPDILRRKVSELNGIRFRMLGETPGYWVGLYNDLNANWRTRLRNPQQAEVLFGQAQRAIQSGDVPSLKAAVSQLLGLLPDDDKAAVTGGFGSTVLG